VEIVGLILTGVGVTLTALGVYFGLLPYMDGVRKDFHALQPNVQIRGASIISAGQSYAIRLQLHNLGKTAAYDGIVTLDGWTGKKDFPVVHPVHPHNVYEESIELGQNSPIRTSKMETAQLRIRYRDRWDYWHEISYPVVQTSRADQLFNVQIRQEQGTMRRPKVSFINMRNHLSDSPSC